MTQSYLDEFAKDNDFIGAIRVSAKTNYNIAQAFSILIRSIILKEMAGTQDNS